MAVELTAEQKFRLHHFKEMASLIRAYKEAFGEAAYQVAVKHSGEKAFAEWKEIADLRESNTIQDLIELLWKPLQKEGFEFTISETNEGVHATCTKCALHDLAQYLGITEEGFYMFCESDPYIVEGFNPNIGLKRTKTLMQGHECCDFFYYRKEAYE